METGIDSVQGPLVSQVTGSIFGIERFCTRDGPGIRTTVFFKGCQLRCAWCHNPEGLSRERQILFSRETCIGCGACVDACAKGAHLLSSAELSGPTHLFDRQECGACGDCVQACPSGALEVVGRSVTVEEVMNEVLQDRVFYSRSHGGLTLSGGEPALQIDFAVALLESAKREGLHTCIETSGFSSWKNYARLLPLVDLFLFDFKESDPKRHIDFVGQSNRVILENLKALHGRGAAIQLQCIIVPGSNDRDDHLFAIAALATELPGLGGVRLLSYHSLGAAKQRKLGVPDGLSSSSVEAPGQLVTWTKRLNELGIRVLT